MSTLKEALKASSIKTTPTVKFINGGTHVQVNDNVMKVVEIKPQGVVAIIEHPTTKTQQGWDEYVMIDLQMLG